MSPGLSCVINSWILRCAGRPVSGECQGEMLDYRRMLMEDFSLSPEIVLHCRTEIEAHCSGLHRKGRTLHCLMRIGRGDRSTTVDGVCQSAVRLQPLFSLWCLSVKGTAVRRDCRWLMAWIITVAGSVFIKIVKFHFYPSCVRSTRKLIWSFCGSFSGHFSPYLD